jgi:hypothetical protein
MSGVYRVEDAIERALTSGIKRRRVKKQNPVKSSDLTGSILFKLGSNAYGNMPIEI